MNTTSTDNGTDTSDNLHGSNGQFTKLTSEIINRYKQDIEELRTRYNKQKEFISIAVHELRSPITPILGTLELIEFEFEETGSEVVQLRKEVYDRLVRNANRLERLASEILDVTKISDHSMRLEKHDFNLSTVLAEAIEDYRRQIKQSNISTKLIYEIDSEQENDEESGGRHSTNEVLVYGDRDRISQVIYNLLGNAIKFTQQGTITVLISQPRTDPNRSEILISIKDTGTGIHPEILPRLFCVFATKSGTGTGLGLFISKNIIEAHGGRMWGENNANGRGATFSFTMPAKKD
jgi:signal transduction histidine kinase